MINFLLIFFGLISTNDKTEAVYNNQTQTVIQLSNDSGNIDSETDNDTGGNTGQKPPFTQP